MGKTIIEKIMESHSGRQVCPGDIIDLNIDVRVARDFGGANVVKHIRENELPIDDPQKTFFTFDCNPGGSDQKYATNQQVCRIFAREHGIKVFDINSGIGTHIAIENGLVYPGATFVSTDSHANIMGAIGAFGQGMGDVDIAHAFAYGTVWFKVPPTIKIVFKGTPSPLATAKDLTLALLRKTGANGLLGYAAEFYGEVVDKLGLSGRITIASMITEAGGIIGIFPPNAEVVDLCSKILKKEIKPVLADPDADYDKVIEIDAEGLKPLASKPGHPEDVVPVEEIAGVKIDSAFIGSCTNGRYEDLTQAAQLLEGKKIAPGVVLKVVPATDAVWRRCLNQGIIRIFKEAGALVGNAGCAGCANGQIGQNGPHEVTISTGNRNFAGKQGKGQVYLASPATVVASAIAGEITTVDRIPDSPRVFVTGIQRKAARTRPSERVESTKPVKFRGRVWVIPKDNIDTDMIYHNRYLTVTDVKEMGKYTFVNFQGWEEFAQKAKPGDIIVTGKNFGAGSSRQQAVDCFVSLGVSLIIAQSFGAIYERNAINRGFPIMTADLLSTNLENGQEIEVNVESGKIILPSGDVVQGTPMSEVQFRIYQKGGLLK